MNRVVSTKIYDLLRNIVHGNIEDYTISVHDPNKKGEGFLGEICFVSLKEKNNGKVIDLVIKQAFSDEKLRIEHPIRKYYLNEIYFYTKVWPCFTKIQKDNSILKPFDKIPKCFGASSEFLHEKLALENLRLQNFQIYNKRQPFDDQHFNFILRQYGKYHAISFAYKKLHPEEFIELTKDLENLFGNLGAIKSFCGFIDYVYELSLKSLDPQEDVEVVEKFKRFAENATEDFRTRSVYHGDYSVLVHGDCWSNNMLFKYNEKNELCDVRLLDFQFIKVGTPVSDLSYFIYSGGSKEIFDQLDHYLRIYHNSLLETVEEFGLDSGGIYPFEQLKKDWKKHCQMGFTMGMLLWRSKLIDDDAVVDLTDLADGDDAAALFGGTKFDEEGFKLRSRDLIVHMAENDYL